MSSREQNEKAARLKKFQQQLKDAEEFIITCYCEELEEWVPIEISPNPYPKKGGEAEQLAAAGSRTGFIALGTPHARATVSPEWIKAHR